MRSRTGDGAPAAGDAGLLVGLLREGYDYVGNRCDRLGSEVFRTRILVRPAICMRGAEAAELLYDEARFTRHQAMPRPVLHLLQDEGSVATLDGEAHRSRKRLFMSMMTDLHRERMRAIFTERWRSRLCTDAPRSEVVLHDEVRQILCESVYAWCGIDLPSERVPETTARLSAMIDDAAVLGPHHWYARLLRRRAERDLAERVTALRARGEADPERDPLHAIAFHRDVRGDLLDPPVAAVELLNLLRPTVAVARFICFAGHALAAFPEAQEACRSDEKGAIARFVREVRRFYPFFPLVAARVRQPFEWHGFACPEGWHAVLDLYGTNRHPDLWPDPDRFDPERHADREPTAFDLIPQGGGDHRVGHRCAGEWMTIDLIEEAARLLSQEMHYEVPPESLRIDRRIPAKPANGFAIRGVRGRRARG